MTSQDEIRILQRIAVALENLKPPPEPPADIKSHDAYIWDGASKRLDPAIEPRHIDLNLLVGIDNARDTLLANTRQFAKGFPANNALLWGARGMGKSSLIKAIWSQINKENPRSVVLIEIAREELNTLPQLIHLLLGWVIRRFILFCDDLSFDANEHSYKSLKTVLEGGIEERPDHIIFYATSNRRHLMPRDMIDNEQSTAIHPGEAVEEKVSLSDRFGLWLGFHHCSQEMYLAMVDGYAKRYNLSATDIHEQAIQWAQTRGARSGRVAWQFINDLAGKMGKRIQA